MAKPGQSSFRRILLSRILLLSVPVLLIGEAVIFKKARTSLLETTSHNLIQSAVKKGKSINDAVVALEANIFLASQTTVLQTGTAKAAKQFIDQLATQLPTQIQCIQLTNPQTNNIVASTCGNKRANLKAAQDWWRFVAQPLGNRDRVYIEPVLPQESRLQARSPSGGVDSPPPAQLRLRLSAPVYTRVGQLRYVLSIQANLQEQEPEVLGAGTIHTVVVAQNGPILTNPLIDRNQPKSQQEIEATKLRDTINQVVAEQNHSFPLFYFNANGVELIAGYNVIPSPLTGTWRLSGFSRAHSRQKWIVLSVMCTADALSDLLAIKMMLIVLTLGLVGASLFATLYMARDLARPLEKLRDYALSVQSYQGEMLQGPCNFKIRELNQLAEALNHMVERLQARTLEIETAWEAAQTANQLKSEFLATTSHELRTPLNGIIGCVRLVRDGCCDDREEELQFLQQADEAAIHLLGIINDLLDISKIEAGKLSVVMELVDLRQVLQEAINLQTIQIQQKGLQLVVPDLQEPVLVQADAAKLKQVLLNVISNAVKFTEQGQIAIAMRIEPAGVTVNGNSCPHVIVTVEDTGVGIDPAQQQKLFRPFVMVDGTTTRKFGGTGLGLAISRNLVELMGGSIMLCSAGQDQGTTVALSLPLADVSRLRSTEAKASAM